MGDIALRVDGLGKMYHLGAQQQGYKTLGDQFRKLHPASLRAMLRRGRRAESKPPFWALKDVSFEVKRGEVVGVIGRNGAGKSTLLKILSRITEPTEGGADIHGRVGSLLEVGTGFHPELTGRENIYLNGAILGMKRAEIVRKFDEIVAFAEVEKFIDTPVKYYSSGMYVRLAFAVAAHLEPEILIVDEVLAVGDAQFQEKCLGRMGEVAKGGRTVLFVSHNMSAIRQLCSTGLLLVAGRVVFAGDVGACAERYAQRGESSGSRILDHLHAAHPAFTVDLLRVNDSDSDELTLISDERRLTIHVEGVVHEPTRFEVEARLHDVYDTPLAYFNPAYDRGTTQPHPAGPFSLRRVIKLPRLHQGVYYINILLSEANVGAWVRIDHAVRLLCEGSSTATGQVFHCNQGIGWMFLEEEREAGDR